MPALRPIGRRPHRRTVSVGGIQACCLLANARIDTYLQEAFPALQMLIVGWTTGGLMLSTWQAVAAVAVVAMTLLHLASYSR
jgi:hypothetical protein